MTETFPDFDRKTEPSKFWEAARASAIQSSHSKVQPYIGMVNLAPKSEQDKIDVASNNMQLSYMNILGQFVHYSTRLIDQKLNRCLDKLISLEADMTLLKFKFEKQVPRDLSKLEAHVEWDEKKVKDLENKLDAILLLDKGKMKVESEPMISLPQNDHLWLTALASPSTASPSTSVKLEPSAPPLPQDDIWEEAIKKVDPEKMKEIKEEVDKSKKSKFVEIIKSLTNQAIRYGVPLATILGHQYFSNLPWYESHPNIGYFTPT